MSEGLIRDLEALRDRIRPYDNGRGEGGYFADELDELIKAWKPILGESRMSTDSAVRAAPRRAERTSGGDVVVMITAGIDAALTDHKSNYGATCCRGFALVQQHDLTCPTLHEDEAKPSEVPVSQRARLARGGRGEVDAPPGRFERAARNADGDDAS